jgi:hypothetical protein
MANILTRLFGAAAKKTSGGENQSTIPIPVKALPNSSITTPTYIGSARQAKIANSAQNPTSVDRNSFARNSSTLNATIANLVRTSPELSQSIASKLALALSPTTTAIALNINDQTVNPEATLFVQSLILRLNTQSPDPTGFQRSTDLRSTSSQLLMDLLRFGAMAAELVLDKGRKPSLIKPFSSESIVWTTSTDLKSSTPSIKTKDKTGQTVDTILDFATIFYSVSSQDNATAYAESPIIAAIQPILWSYEFSDSLRRAATKNLLQRLLITINSEKWMQRLPLEVQADASKMSEAITQTISSIESQINGLSPEDALVIFDNLEADTISDSNRSEDRSIEVLEKLINGQISAGSRTLPSIIGKGESSSAASTESQLFLKAIATIQTELNTLFSRIFTLCARLYGFDVAVNFSFEEPNLRPSLELESFKSVRQARILDQLSLGLISDIEASIMLTGTVPPAGYKDLAGTYFKIGPVDTAQNDYSNTSATASGKPNATQTEKDSNPDTPTGVPGKNSPSKK